MLPLAINSQQISSNLLQQKAPSTFNDRYSSTIQEVEDLIRTNPKLPRLTRGEILDILENITLEDGLKTVSNASRKEKAVMVVLPYSPKDGNENVQELYTKPPITKIIDNEPSDKYKYTEKFESHTTSASIPVSVTESIKPTQPTTPKQKYKIRPSTQLPHLSAVPVMVAQQTYTQPHTLYGQPEFQKRRPFYRTSTMIPIYSPMPQKQSTFKPLPSYHVESNQGINIVSAPKYERLKYEVPKQETYKYEKTKYNDSKNTPLPYRNTQSPYIIRTTSRTPLHKVTANNLPLPNDYKDVLSNLDVLIQHDNKNPIESITKSSIKMTTTPSTTPMPNIENVVNNLSPDMQELLMSFGIIPNPKENIGETSNKVLDSLEPVSEIKPESYSSFKPLPLNDNNEPNTDMNEFLSQFGLAPSNKKNREQKAIGTSTLNHFNKKNSQKVNVNIMDPDDKTPVTEDEIKRLNKLMGIIKQLEALNGTVSEEDLKHVDIEDLTKLVNSFNTPQPERITPLHKKFVPDIINDENHNVQIKNEIKRQQSTENPSLALLESFGGDESNATANKQVISPETPKEEEITTTTLPPRPNGFYYLLDWNSFFEIDDQKGKSVNLRFQPKVGDPKRFYDVHVP